MKTPEQCENAQEIGAEIDRLDRLVIAAWAERYAYVLAATKFKASKAEVAAPDRLRAMLEQRRRWAQEGGLRSPDVVEGLYRGLIRYFISEEKRHWQASS